MMKLDTVITYPNKSNNYLNHVTHPLSSGDISIVSSEINKFCYIKKYRYRLNFDTLFLHYFFESSKIILIKMVTILMMSAKMASVGFS